MKKNNQENVFTVASEQTTISFLKKRFSRAPLSLIYKLFRMKKVTIQGKQLRYYHHRVKAGSTIEIDDPKFLEEWGKVQKISKQVVVPPLIKSVILYEDDNILVVVKEHDVEMHNESNREYTLDNEIAYYLTKSGYSSDDDLFIVSSVHRIDKLTRGIVVYPKNSLSKKILHKAFGNKEIVKKNYLAVCENQTGRKIPTSVEGYIYKEDSQEKMIFNFLQDPEKETKHCSMEFEEICSNPPFSLLEIVLGTGRKHQIRSALNYLNLPVIGDKKYGSSILLENKIKLFAYKVEFINLPAPLEYLNKKIFQIDRIREKLASQLSSSRGIILPKKFLKY